jgi:copper chaperone
MPYTTVKSATFSVAGMTCHHCTLSVREEVAEIAGVTDVDVDLESGRLTVGGEFTDDSVREAVAAAGYEVAS